MVFRAKQTQSKQSYHRFKHISLDRETWSKLDKDAQTIWDNLTPEAKNTILTGTRQRAVEIAQNKKVLDPKDFVPAKKTGWRPPPSNGNANVHEFVESEDTQSDEIQHHHHDFSIPTQETQVHDFSDDTGAVDDISDELETSLLINMAKQRLPP
jgi:hypothetical protein